MQWNCSVILPVKGEKITKGIPKEERKQQIKGEWVVLHLG